ncbi:MAG: PVC-type heme-binding CxxCH protein, partial [Rubripirellula sp.]
PVAIEWDANGKLYVCEMRGYSEDRDKALSRIRCLEDTNQDGSYDKSTVYADGLLWPTALFPYDGGLFVGDAPNLYWFRDQDGDGVSDERRTVLTGFGTSNVQGLMNSFRWGLDNRIHIACSSVGGTIHRVEHADTDSEELPDGKTKGFNVRGRDLAFDPKTGEFELTSGAAQHGMCFDDWGRKFVSSNSNHIQQVMYEDRYLARNPFVSAPPARISIAADGPQAEVFRTSPVEPWRIVRTRLRVGGLVPGPVEGGGRAAGYFTGATGVTIYRGDAWSPRWKGLAIIGDVGSNLVHRKRLLPNGAKMIAQRIDEASEFITSTDIWFRPAQFANGPDGNLYIIDVCREVIEHPKSLPPGIKEHLDLTAGRDRGRIYRVRSQDAKNEVATRMNPRLTDATSSALVSLLDHENAWQRETAARLIYERQDQSVDSQLRSLAMNGQRAQGRLHALYALQGLSLLDETTVIQALRDEHPQVRRHAIRLSEQFSESQKMFEAIATLASDPSLEVQIQLAFSLGQFDDSRRIATLASLIRNAPSDRWIHAAVQSSIVNGAGALFAKLILDPDFRTDGGGRFLQRIASQIGQQQTQADLEQALSVLPELDRSDAGFVLPVLGSLMSNRGRRDSPLNRMAESGELDSVDALVSSLIDTASERAVDESQDIESRLAAIRSLAFGDLNRVHQPLVSLISNRQPDAIAGEAIKTLGSFSAPSVTSPVLDAWPGLSPRLRGIATEVLFARPERTLALFDAVSAAANDDAGDDGIALSDIGTPRLKIAAQSRDKRIRSRAQQFLASMGTQDRAEVVQRYQGVFDLTGDVKLGRKLFQKHCSVCHKVEGVGHEIGPSLASIKTRGAESILVNVLDPNREVNPEFLNYVVLTEDGRAMTGMISAETATSVTLRRAENASDTVLRVDIDRLKSTGLSIMPEGLEENIDPKAMADIIAYLMQAG